MPNKVSNDRPSSIFRFSQYPSAGRTFACPFKSLGGGALTVGSSVLGVGGAFSISSLTPSSLVSPRLGKNQDLLKFSMQVGVAENCCQQKFAASSMSGCCAGIPTEVHDKRYIDSLRAEILKTGKIPKLNDEVIARLKVLEALKPLEALAAGQKKSLWKKIALFPVQVTKEIARLVKWIAVSIWQDTRLSIQFLKNIFSRKKTDPA